MPERQFDTRSASAFVKLVLHPIGLWGNFWRRKDEVFESDKKRGVREAWLRVMAEPSSRHGQPWGKVIVDELERTNLRCLTHPDERWFQEGAPHPWFEHSGKDRKTKGLLICRELGLNVEPFVNRSGDQSVRSMLSRNWSLSTYGKQLVKKVRRIDRRGKAVANQEMTTRQAFEWVAENWDNQNIGLDETPNGTARGLLKLWRENPERWGIEYMKLAYRDGGKQTVGQTEAPKEQASVTLEGLAAEFEGESNEG